MGLLIKGRWLNEWYDTKSHEGAFEREAAQLRHWITVNGQPGSSGDGGFKAESHRYHLYVSLACPWAHRTLIFRKLKQLDAHISVSVVSPDMLDQGWTFSTEADSSGDPIHHYDFLHQVYTANRPDYSGRVTVPVLWDKKTKKIVNNESSEIIRMFNSAFNAITGNHQDFYPTSLAKEIDDINAFVYDRINNGVYRCGFATTQSAYEEGFIALFDALDQLDERLGRHRYLVGDTITEADWRLFTTLIRFDMVYYGHFKCNKRRVEDYVNLPRYLRTLYQWPGVAETVDFYHIKRHYYYSHMMINPTQIVPLGPEIDYTTKPECN